MTPSESAIAELAFAEATGEPKHKNEIKVAAAFGCVAVTTGFLWLLLRKPTEEPTKPTPAQVYKKGVQVYLGKKWYLTGVDGSVPKNPMANQPPAPVDPVGQVYSAMVKPPSPLYGTLNQDISLYTQANDSLPPVTPEHNGSPLRINAYDRGGYQQSEQTWASVTMINDGSNGWVPISAISNTSTKNPAGTGL